MSARKKFENNQDFACGPCEGTRISARAVVFCSACKDAFCGDCSKLHKAGTWTQNHVCVNVSDIDSRDLIHLKERKDRQPVKVFKQNSIRHGKDFVKTKYLEELKSNHDHSKEDLDNEMFCVDHRSVLCELCQTKHHSLCTHIIPVAQAVKDIQTSKEPASLAASLKKYNVFAKEMVDDRIKQEALLDDRKKEIIPQIHAVRERVNKLLDELEGTLLLNLLGRHENDKNSNHQLREKCAGIQRATESSMLELRAVYTKGKVSDSRYLKTLLRVRDRCPVYEKCLKEAYDAAKNKDYLFKVNEQAEEWSISLKSLGTIEEIQCPITMSAFLFIDRKNSKACVSTECKKLDIASTEEDSPVYITGIRCVSSGDILVVDRNAPALELVDSNSEVLMAYKLDCLPWDVALLSATEVVITVPGDKAIKIFEIDHTEGKFSHKQDIVCSNECWGITCCDGNFYVTVDPWKPTVSVKILSPEGEEIGVFKDKVISGSALFKAPQHIACHKGKGEVYVSDSGRHAVTAFDLHGNLKFGYMSRDMGYPTGLTVDDFGHVFVCAKETKNVHKILPGFKEGKIVLTEKDGISNARAISVHPNKQHCLVANSGSGAVIPFKLL